MKHQLYLPDYIKNAGSKIILVNEFPAIIFDIEKITSLLDVLNNKKTIFNQIQDLNSQYLQSQTPEKRKKIILKIEWIYLLLPIRIGRNELSATHIDHILRLIWINDLSIIKKVLDNNVKFTDEEFCAIFVSFWKTNSPDMKKLLQLRKIVIQKKQFNIYDYCYQFDELITKILGGNFKTGYYERIKFNADWGPVQSSINSLDFEMEYKTAGDKPHYYDEQYRVNTGDLASINRLFVPISEHDSKALHLNARLTAQSLKNITLFIKEALQTAVILNKHQGKTMSVIGFVSMLNNHFYRGFIPYKIKNNNWYDWLPDALAGFQKSLDAFVVKIKWEKLSDIKIKKHLQFHSLIEDYRIIMDKYSPVNSEIMEKYRKL